MVFETYQTKTRVVRLGKNGMRGVENELGEKNLVLAFVNLCRVSCCQCRRGNSLTKNLHIAIERLG